MKVWGIKNSAETYNIENWGAPYFSINEKGNVSVTPEGASPGKPAVDLKDLVTDLYERGLRSPILIRFPDIVKSRIHLLNNAFQNAFQTNDYKGSYRGVFPIKVNQQRYLVEEIVDFGRSVRLGLEAGSKPELLVALAYMDNPEALIICNGFKDADYIETALLSQKLGRNTIIVVDRYSELEAIVRAAKALNISPRVGFRAKLDTKGAGKWVESSGARSKFGLTAAEMIKGVELLKDQGLLSSLQLLHFHIGSQITALRAIKDSMVEATRIYVELALMGAGLKYVDVGGGLGVDYDGSQTNWENSINYSVQDYANDVVYQIAAACNSKNIPHPDIVTEAGRALVAHHSVLIMDVVGADLLKSDEMPLGLENEKNEKILELRYLCESLSTKNLNEHLQDAFKIRDDSLQLFNLGYMSLREKGVLENLYRAFCSKVLQVAATMPRPPEEIAGLKKNLADAFYCNFSIFQSAPDSWAVDQLFPIMPIHRLQEEPTRRGILLDLTCDSDGKIDRFIDPKDVRETLELHCPKPGELYFIGMFLVGAYQEILGDFHNLFGDTDAVHVSVHEGGYTIDHVIEGDTIKEVLGYVEYDRLALVKKVRQAVELGLAQRNISLEESRLLMKHYEDALNSYTYLECAPEDRNIKPVDALRRLGQKQLEAAALNEVQT